MTRRLIAGLIVVGLAIGVWLLWPRSEPGTGTTTTALAVGSTTTSGPTTVPKTSPVSTTAGTTLAVQNRDVDTVEEAEAILRELWFGWFEGIYNQDEDRIKEVVASQQLLDNARSAFDGSSVSFSSRPNPEGMVFDDLEIVQSDETCLVVWAHVSATFRDGDSEGLQVLRWDDPWKLFSLWANRNDLWQDDCESLLEPLS